MNLIRGTTYIKSFLDKTASNLWDGCCRRTFHLLVVPLSVDPSRLFRW